MLVKADGFISELLMVKSAWLAGRMGGGKTLLAVAIAAHLHKEGMVTGCIANMPTDLPLPDWKSTLLRSVAIILDESHIFIDARSSMLNQKGYGAMSRKLGLIWLFPSVYSIDVRQRALTVQRTHRLSIPGVRLLVQSLRAVPLLGRLIKATPLNWFGSEIWVYNYDMGLGYTESKGTFWLVNPESYYTRYDTQYMPLTDAGILDLFEATVEDEQSKDVGEGTWYVYEDELSEQEQFDLGCGAYGSRPGGTSARTSAGVFASARAQISTVERIVEDETGDWDDWSGTAEKVGKTPSQV